MDQLLTHWLRIRDDERRRTALLFLLLFFSTSYIIVGRAARDALLLSRMGVAQLPVVYVAVAVASSIVVILYNRLLRHWNPATVLRGELVLAIAVLLGLRYLIATEWRGVYHTFYVFHEVAGSMLSVLFWTFANESFTTREAKRLFGIIGSGGVMAGTVFGFGGAYLAPRLGTPNLLLVCVGLLMGSLGVLWMVRSTTEAHEVAPLPAVEPDARDFKPYARSVALLAIVIAVAASIIDFEFKAVTQRYFSEDQLAAFFGILYGACGLLSFFFHLLLTGRLLIRTGILPALLTLPIALSFGAVGLLAGPLLALVVYEKAADATLRYSLNETCLQLLYFPLPVRLRRRLKALIEGWLKPLAIGSAGVLFMLMGTESRALTHLSWVLVAVLIAWIAIAPGIKRRYVAALLAGLTRRSPIDSDVPIMLSDMASVQALVEALRSPDPNIVLEALELLPAHRGGEWGAHVTTLLRRPDGRLRAAALAYCRQEHVDVPDDILNNLLVDEDEDVRSAAIDFVRSPEELRMHLPDPSPAVRAKVIVALVQNSVDPASEVALEELDRMSHDHDDDERRSRAAWAMGELATNEAGLRRLVQDPSPDVQREALDAAGKAQFLDLIPLLIARMRDPVTGDEAAAALGRYGEAALGSLLDLFPLSDTQPIFRHNVFVALQRIGTRRVVEALLHRLPADRAMRTEVLQAAFHILRTRKEGPLRLDQVRTPLLVEIQDGYQWCAIAATLADGGEEWDLLRMVVGEELAQARERALLLLALVYPVRPLLAVSDALAGRPESDMANAVELVDELIDPALRRLLVPLLDDIPVEARLTHGKELFSLVIQENIQWCRYFLRSSDRWLILCALNTAGRVGEPRLVGEVRGLLKDSDAVVRQEAACALSHLLDDARWARVVEDLKTDPDMDVRQVARTRTGGDSQMISSVDKVLFLRKVALFSQLSSRELLNVASIAQQVEYPESAVLLKEGDEADSLYLILSGDVAVQTGGRTVAVLGPRECVGEMAILDREPRSATVVALDHVSALRIDRDSFYDVLAQKREIALGIIKILVQRLREANIRPGRNAAESRRSAES